DDAQTNVKAMLNDADLRERLLAQKTQFSSANSMNIGRLVPQIVYYVYAYAQLVKTNQITAGDKVNFTVPTGNFGNILAAYYASQIGLPVG
ncbi:threonine synthase, partial [Streptococcus suis]